MVVVTYAGRVAPEATSLPALHNTTLGWFLSRSMNPLRSFCQFWSQFSYDTPLAT
jgi:hypothetical protein